MVSDSVQKIIFLLQKLEEGANAPPPENTFLDTYTTYY